MKKLEFLKSLNAVNGSKSNLINKLISVWHENEEFSLKHGEIKDSLVDDLYKACYYFLYLFSNESSGFRDETNNITFYRLLKKVITNDEAINYFGILCPSYRKGMKQKGFAAIPGDTTYRAFQNLIVMQEITRLIGIRNDARMFFADISVERYDEFSRKDWQDFANIIKMDSIIAKCHDIKFMTLTEFDSNLARNVGYKGYLHNLSELDISPKALERSMWRDRRFYPENFGWTTEEAETRTKIHAHSYSCQANSIRKKLENPVMVYSAYDYEKGGMYNGRNNSLLPCIIYPDKTRLIDHHSSLTRVNSLKELLI